MDYGVKMSRREKGSADYAGNRDDRKSTTSFQIYIDGDLIESRVRMQ